VKSILDPTFEYVKAQDTDIRKTFERIRREQAQAQPRWVPAEPTKKLVATVHALRYPRRSTTKGESNE
jgi:hypothetical protein